MSAGTSKTPATIVDGSRRDTGARYLLILACLVVAIAGLRAAATLIIPLLLAVFVALLSLPRMVWLQRRGLPKILSVVTTVVADIALLAGVGFLVAGSVNEFTGQLPKYQTNLEQALSSLVSWVQARGVPLDATDFIDAGAVVDLVGGAVTRAAAVLQQFFLVALTTIFILFEAAYLPAKVRSALGARLDRFERLSRVASDIQQYLGIKTVISLATGILVGLWVGFLKIDFPVFWGLVAFFFNYIPNIGSIVASIPTVLIALVQFDPTRAALVGIGYVVINVSLGNFLEPTLMGHRFGLSPLVVFLSLVFWGWVWGPMGMLLSVPLTIIVKIMLENTEDFRWLAILLGSGKEASSASPSD